MATDLEEQKKLLLPILQRAEEIQAVEPRMAYYCRLYAIKKGLEIPNPTKEIQGLIRATFSQCEKDKPIVKPVEDTDRAECEAFALGVFRRADRVDRAGRADANTSKAFYAAAIFMQVLEQFLDKGEEMEVAAPDILEKIRYALWRAAEIRRATREGRPPAPPPDAGNGGGAAVPSDLTGSSAFDALPPVVPGAPPPMDSTVMREVEDEEAGEDGAPLSAPADELLAMLPRPPSTVPPEGSTGLVVPAAAAGPRFQQGARVWCAPGTGSSGGGAAGGAVPELGTVGMMAAADGGPGGQAMYKARAGAGKEGKGIRGAFGEDGKSQVALSDRISELSDSRLAPVAAPGAHITYIASHGDSPVPAVVVAVKADAWPVMYLVQLQGGATLDTDGGHISAPADALPPGDAAQQPGVQAPLAPAPQQWQQQQQGAPYSSSSISPYPSARPPPPPSPQQQQQQKPPAPVAAPAAPLMPAPVPGFTPSSTAISDAQKAAKYAASSLAFDDVAGGIKYLTDALRLLTQPAQPRR